MCVYPVGENTGGSTLATVGYIYKHLLSAPQTRKLILSDVCTDLDFESIVDVSLVHSLSALNAL